MEKQLLFKIDKDKHKEIKMRATEKGISMKEFVISLVEKELKKSKEEEKCSLE